MPLRVAVIDLTNRFYPIIMRMKAIEVVLLYGPSDTEIDEMVKYGNTKIIRKLEPSTWINTFASKEDIIKYRSTQLKVERYGQRFNVIPSYATSQYYHSLAFWNHYLCDYSIDCLLIVGTEHGSPLDSVPIDVAKSKDIPVFLFDILYGVSNYTYLGILCKNTGKYLNLNEIDTSISLINFNDILSPSSIQITDDGSQALSILDNFSVNNMHLKSICNVIKKMIFLHAKICVSFFAMFGKQLQPNKYYENDLNVVIMFHALFVSFVVKYSRKNQCAMAMDVENHYLNLLTNIMYLSKLRHYYRKHSKRCIDPTTDGLLYALHFEPEASIMNRTIYDSQIYILEMLSSVLPKGWKILVKEHPHQFRRFNTHSLHLYKEIPIYRRTAYYDRLLEIPNVELVDDRISSSDVLNPIKYPKIHAIATINGTISAECISSGKPVILFGSESTVYDDIPGLFKITDADRLKDAIDEIVSGNVFVDRQKIEEIGNYLIKMPSHPYSKELMQISEKTLLALISNSKKIAQV